MLKITILVLLGIIIFLFFGIKKGRPRIDNVHNKENFKNMKQLQLDIQNQLNKIKTNNKK